MVFQTHQFRLRTGSWNDDGWMIVGDLLVIVMMGVCDWEMVDGFELYDFGVEQMIEFLGLDLFHQPHSLVGRNPLLALTAEIGEVVRTVLMVRKLHLSGLPPDLYHLTDGGFDPGPTTL